jgi:hypothetical protein
MATIHGPLRIEIWGHDRIIVAPCEPITCKQKIFVFKGKAIGRIDIFGAFIVT